MSNSVYVLGNGLSREKVNPYQLKGTIIGCNACYRDFKPDILCAIDAGVIFDIVESGYDGDCYFTHSSWNPLPAEMRKQLKFDDGATIYETKNKSENFVVISGFDDRVRTKSNFIIWEPHAQSIKNICIRDQKLWDFNEVGWSAGTSAAYVACRDLNPDKIYLIGFDHQKNSYDNIYADTPNYYTSGSDKNWGNVHKDWTKQLIKLFKWYPDIDFYWVNPTTKWPKQDNLHFIERV